ncbi:hypothetical protein [Methylomagnum sp.]
MPVMSELPVSGERLRTPSHRHAISGAFLAALPGLIAPVHADEWIADASARLFHESNINHAAYGAAVLDDFAFAPQVALGRYFQLADADGLTLTANAKGAVFGQYSGLNSIHGGGAFGLKHKFGLGAYAPWLRVHGSAGYTEYDSRWRDSGLFQGGVQLGRRFDPRFGLWIGYGFDYRDGRDSRTGWWGKPGNVFTLSGHRVSVHSDFLLTDDVNLSLGYGVRFGGIYSDYRLGSGRPLPPAPAAVRDDAFPGYIAYRIDHATTHDFSLEASYALSGHASLAVRYEFQVAYGGGLSYANHAPRISFDYSF